MNKIAFASLVLTLILSCSKKAAPPVTTSVINGLMALSVGNSWTYTKVSYDSNTGLPTDTSGDAINIISEVTIDTTTYYQQNQTSITNINAGSFFYNSDSNTLRKIDSAVNYVFFKRVNVDSLTVDSWPDTITNSRCKGHNTLMGFTNTTVINGYICLRNEVAVSDCTGLTFQNWVYYLKPGLGLVRIQHYAMKQDQSFYLDFQEDLQTFRIIP